MIDFSIMLFFFIFYFLWIFIARQLEAGKRLIVLLVIASSTLFFMAVIFIPDPTIIMPYCINYNASGQCIANTIKLDGLQTFVIAFGSSLLPFVMMI